MVQLDRSNESRHLSFKNFWNIYFFIERISSICDD